jgi:hypothetical protein
MDRLLVVIALRAPHRELPGGHPHHRRPILSEDRGRGGREGCCLRGWVPLSCGCRRTRGRACVRERGCRGSWYRRSRRRHFCFRNNGLGRQRLRSTHQAGQYKHRKDHRPNLSHPHHVRSYSPIDRVLGHPRLTIICSGYRKLRGQIHGEDSTPNLFHDSIKMRRVRPGALPVRATGMCCKRSESYENKEAGRFDPAPAITIHRKRGAGTYKQPARGCASEVWWRRRELNPGPKTFSATDLHV